MSDNRRRYRAIRKALAQCYPQNPQGNLGQTPQYAGGPHQWYCGEREFAAAENSQPRA